MGTTAIGDLVTIGDWDIRITKVTQDADDIIAGANMFNDKPRGQYVMVTYDATYHGTERTGDVEMGDLWWTFTTPDQKVHETSWQVDPASNQNWPTETHPGGTVRAMEVFDIKGPITPSLITVEDYMLEEYADFPLRGGTA